MSKEYAKINYEVMTDTVRCYCADDELRRAIEHSLREQYMVHAEEIIELPRVEASSTGYVVSGKRSLEAAKEYTGKKVAVLNFANNHSVGGAPFSAGAQEESICRCSTLFPCITAMDVPFYRKHRHEYEKGKINHMGSDDLIYTPDVVVFKTDERTDPVVPSMMPRDKWYRVNIITCAAPEVKGRDLPEEYESLITRRIGKILDVAAKEQNEVLVLGAWGCGAFGNPSDVVAKAFGKLLVDYNFETVEFALSTSDFSSSPFAGVVSELQRNNGK